MLKAMAISLALAGAVVIAQPVAQAAPRLDGITQDFSAATTVVVKKRRHRVVVREYHAPAYYGYYGPTYYERPYARPNRVVFGVGGWW